MELSRRVKINEYSNDYKDKTKLVVLTVLKSLGFETDSKKQSRDNDLDNILDSYKDDARFWLALLDDEVIGTIAIERKDHNPAYLRRMFVLPEFHGKGVAIQLLERAINFARERRYKDLYLKTHIVMERAHRFYERNYFIKIGKTDEGYLYKRTL